LVAAKTAPTKGKAAHNKAVERNEPVAEAVTEKAIGPMADANTPININAP
jgi:hypothetical protein